ncbi:MAG: alpha/beta hydrolase [Bacillota bacterium]
MQKAVEMVSQGLTLRGMLHMPDKSEGNVPVVVLFHGFTGNKMEPHFIFVKLSRMLEKKGIASVRFDFGGSGESDGDFVNMTLSGEVRDAHNILDYVKQLDGIDTGRIGAAGLSMGGAVASILASERNDEIKCLCLWAPAGNISALLTSNLSENDICLLRKKGFLDRAGFLVGANFIDDVAKLNIYEMAKNYRKNVLLLHGDNDTAVPVSASETYLRNYGATAELKVISGADHTFNRFEWEKEVLDSTVEFFCKELL